MDYNKIKDDVSQTCFTSKVFVLLLQRIVRVGVVKSKSFGGEKITRQQMSKVNE